MSIDVVNLGGAHASGNPMEQHDLGTMASDVLSMVSQGQLDPLITAFIDVLRAVVDDGVRVHVFAHIVDIARRACGEHGDAVHLRELHRHAADRAGWTYPHILGLDVAGEIVEIGEGVEDTWKVGMRVAGHGDPE